MRRPTIFVVPASQVSTTSQSVCLWESWQDYAHIWTAVRDESLHSSRETEPSLPRSATHLRQNPERLRGGPLL